MNTDNKVGAFIEGATRLPVMPRIIARLLVALRDPDTSADDVAQIIAADTSLSARLLKLVNSPFYGLSGKISNVHRALVILGRKTVQSLIVTIWTQTMTQKGRNPREIRVMADLFEHGVACAVSSKILTRRIDQDLSEDAFIAGLLHDIGRVALVGQLGMKYVEDLLGVSATSKAFLCEMERQQLGFDHCALGAALLHSWHLPEELIRAANDHHNPDLTLREAPITAGVSMGDQVATTMGINAMITVPRIPQQHLKEEFQIQEEESFQHLIEECQIHIESLMEQLTIS